MSDKKDFSKQRLSEFLAAQLRRQGPGRGTGSKESP